MATFTASAAQSDNGIQPKALKVGLVAVSATYSIVNSLSIGSTIQMVKVPAGAAPVFVAVALTGGGQATLSVGDGLNNARYKADSTTSAAAGMVIAQPAADVYTYSVDDTIDVFISLVSVTTLGGAVYLRAIYSMDPV